MAGSDDRSFGYLLRRYRLAALLTQEQLAERAHLSYRTISDLERGAKHTPRRDTVLLLADALELPAKDRAVLIAAVQPADQPETSEPPADQVSSETSVRIFLIADLRGYTSFTEAHGDEAAAQLTSRFAALVRDCVEQYAGQLVETRGDEVLVTFTSARQALRGAIRLQESCAEVVKLEADLPLHVGIGIDAGEAVPVEAGYRGGALNLAARLCSIAGAGEVFCSEGVIHLARKTNGITFVDRGEVILKGLSSPIRVIQIAPEGVLPAELPPLQPLLVTHPNNLPDEPTPFIGREREIDQIVGMLQDPHIRMATLTGPGGTGKTRLALQVGMALLDNHRDGVFFVNLAPLADPALVPSAIAEALGVKETGDRSLLDALVHHLKEKHLLLVLDNYEHLLEGAPVAATLLDACRKLHILVTSRIPLHLSREHEYAVPPLSVPDLTHLPDLASLSQYEAVALFIDRARAVKADFEVTNATAPAVAEMCSRLDGLPLAIELAAARIKLFPPGALLQRLDRRLKLLTGGARDRPTRQQTLRNTIDWSYSLLSQPEQTLFARLSVFAGGCTLEAVEAVCGPEGEIEIVDGVTSLLEQSLLREMGEQESRFSMLDTIREYAHEPLEASDDAESVRERHGAFYLALAEEAKSELIGPRQVQWLNRLEVEHDNLRAALERGLAKQRSEESLRLATALWWFWSTHGHLSEGSRWLERALAVDGERSTTIRAKALNGAGGLAYAQGDYQRSTTLHVECLSLFRELGNTGGIASSLGNLGMVAFAQGDYERATALHDESLVLERKLGNTQGVASSLSDLGNVAFVKGDYERAATLYEESLTLARRLGDTSRIAASLGNLGMAAFAEGEVERAATLHDECLSLFRELQDPSGIAGSLVNLGEVASARGDYDRAIVLCRESLVVARESGDHHIAVESIETLGGVAARHLPERAARLWGAADAWREANRVPLPPVDRQQRERMAVQAGQQVGEAAWTTAWEKGRAMSFEQAVAYALEETA